MGRVTQVNEGAVTIEVASLEPVLRGVPDRHIVLLRYKDTLEAVIPAERQPYTHELVVDIPVRQHVVRVLVEYTASQYLHLEVLLEPVPHARRHLLQFPSVRFHLEHLTPSHVNPEMTELAANHVAALGARIAQVGAVVLDAARRKQPARSELVVVGRYPVSENIYSVIEGYLVLKTGEHLLRLYALQRNEPAERRLELMVVHRPIRQPRVCHTVLRNVLGAPDDTVRTLVGAIPETLVVGSRELPRALRHPLGVHVRVKELLVHGDRHEPLLRPPLVITHVRIEVILHVRARSHPIVAVYLRLAKELRDAVEEQVELTLGIEAVALAGQVVRALPAREREQLPRLGVGHVIQRVGRVEVHEIPREPDVPVVVVSERNHVPHPVLRRAEHGELPLYAETGDIDVTPIYISRLSLREVAYTSGGHPLYIIDIAVLSR